MSREAIEIDTLLVRRLIATQFPEWRDLPIRPVERSGWDNRTFHLGDDKSVRLPSAERYAAQVEKEQGWLPRLAPFLPLPIPTPLAVGTPAEGYPWQWSVYGWIEGASAMSGRISDLPRFARELAQFLTALQKIDTTGGPLPGAHNFYRGGELVTYDAETRQAIRDLGEKIDAGIATEIWEWRLHRPGRGHPSGFMEM